MDKHTAPPQLEHPAAAERLRIEGALELLDLLHEELLLRCDKVRDASGREVFDEVITQVDAVLVEYRRREAALPHFAGRTLRLAEWYVRLHDADPEAVVNETYVLIRIGPEGHADWSASSDLECRHGSQKAAENAALPNATERERMRDLLLRVRT